MRAAVFVRYHSGDGFGHVGWAFEVSPGLVDAGSVENHSGHLFTPAAQMGFWNGLFTDPIAKLREHRYDDLKWIDVPNPDPILACRTVMWIEQQAYRALHRNCEDDVYDVLRAYGIDDLALPSLLWFPKTWFARFRGTLAHIADYKWNDDPAPCHPEEPPCHPEEPPCHPEVSKDGRGIEAPPTPTTPWQPTWRRPWHPHFGALKLARFQLLSRKK
jgi:hypothetical protein